MATTKPTRYESHNCGRYSSRCKYTKWEYEAHIESWCKVVRGHLYYRIDTDEGIVTSLLRPWRGWHWIIDKYQPCLVDSLGRRDYHPTASDILSRRTTRAIAHLARDNDLRRREMLRHETETRRAIRRAERQGARVCASDSVTAGNCRAGTESWAQRHGLDPTRHYTPSQLLALANGDTERVQLVVTAALRRHRQEMRQGYCQIADHV